MSIKTIEMPEEIVVKMLKSLPEEEIVNIFWKTLIESDTSPLSDEESSELGEAEIEFEQGKSTKWQNLR